MLVFGFELDGVRYEVCAATLNSYLTSYGQNVQFWTLLF
jgi:hypothetical protein